MVNDMKKGFTLIELMFVIVIIAVISATAIVSFSQIDNDTTKKELEDKYKTIQRSASLYVDLNDTWLEQFADRGEIFIKLEELKNSNYISQDLKNRLTGEEIDTSYSVKLFIDEENGHEFVNSCIVNIKTVDGNEQVEYIANSEGKEPSNDEECN